MAGVCDSRAVMGKAPGKGGISKRARIQSLRVELTGLSAAVPAGGLVLRSNGRQGMPNIGQNSPFAGLGPISKMFATIFSLCEYI